ncbi:hypothetical protein KIMH_01790 [Bombiscardovia apis]|uniref:Transcriptional regulator n=1 Tax=Bombiscardovia apis TaxID=2932182 RepID=A0ABM8BB13_9BIFI|nr:XRE family transcriptional regulator [Bombiscardovia apis]BDR54068.1 hypothetical protein KIMH_01790 [Bombiscardovia apis]
MDVTARCERHDGWWAIEVDEIPGLFTQTRRLDQVEDMVRDAASLMGKEIEEVRVLPVMDKETMQAVEEMLQVRTEARIIQERASKVSRKVVSLLRREGLTVRDVAQVTGISSQRVSALQRS